TGAWSRRWRRCGLRRGLTAGRGRDPTRPFECQSVPVGQLLAGRSDRVGSFEHHHEVEDVSAPALAKAVEDVLVQVDVEARPVLASVDRAWPDESPGFLLLETVEHSVPREDIPDGHLTLERREIDPASRHDSSSCVNWKKTDRGSRGPPAFTQPH